MAAPPCPWGSSGAPGGPSGARCGARSLRRSLRAVALPAALCLAPAPADAAPPATGGPAASGPPSPPPPAGAAARRDVLDRHGHAIAHVPPLARDAGCAPALYGAILRAGQAAGQGPIATRLDGGLQLLAQLAVQRGVERLARAPRPREERRAPSPPAVGQILTGVVSAVLPEGLELELAPGWRGLLPLPALRCDGHEGPAAAAPGARFQVGERLRLRVSELLDRPDARPDAAKDKDLGPEAEKHERPYGPVLPASSAIAPPPRPPLRRALVSLEPQAALVALDPATRDVLALVGGHGARPGDFDRAIQGRRQAGSTWKPLVYAAALRDRRYQPDDIVQDLPRLYGDWQPRNFTGTYRGPIRLREALAHSVNTVAVRLLSEVGPAAVAQLAERLGVPRAQVPLDLTQALGTALVSPLQLAGAYAAFADTQGGRYAPPRLLGAPDPGDGAFTAALPPALAYLVTDLLRSVVREGSAARARELEQPGLAGKTGTTSLGNDAWFVGYHSQLLAVVWVGDDAGREVGAGEGGSARTGAETALPLWMDFMRGAAELLGRRPPPLPRPPGLVEVSLPEGAGVELRLADTP